MDKLLDSLGIIPNNKELFIKAFTHSTYANEHPGIESYEKMEYLGDALIQFEVARFLYTHFKLREGDMTLIRANNVKQSALAHLSKKLKLGKYLRYGRGAETLKNTESTLADLFESFIAAIYLDQGLEKVNDFLKITIFAEIKNNWNQQTKDNKTVLQELLQASIDQPVHYETRKVSDDQFVSIVKYEGYNLSDGRGTNKKQAEQDAAFNALQKQCTKKGI